MRTILIVVLGSVVIAACGGARTTTQPPPDPCQQDVCVRPPPVKNKVDVLFVLDDALSMGPAIDAWRASLPRLVGALESAGDVGAPISYHFGVITADLGAGPATLQSQRCRPGGDGAALRTGGVALAGGVSFIDDDGLRHAQRRRRRRRARHHVRGRHERLRVPPSARSRVSRAARSGSGERRLPALRRAARRRLRQQRRRLLGAADDRPVRRQRRRDDRLRHARSLPLHAVRHPVQRHAGAADVGRRPHRVRVTDDGRRRQAHRHSAVRRLLHRAGGAGRRQGRSRRRHPRRRRRAVRSGRRHPHEPVLRRRQRLVVSTARARVRIADRCALLRRSGGTARHRHPRRAQQRAGLDLRRQRRRGRRRARQSRPVARRRRLLFGADRDRRRRHARMHCRRRHRPSGRLDDHARDSVVRANGHVPPCWQLVDRLAQYQSQGCTPPGTTPPPTCKLPASCQPVPNPADGTPELYTLTIDRGTSAAGTPNPAPVGTIANIQCATP